MSIMCIYHGNCADGFGAAWALHSVLGDDVEYVAGYYGESPPDVTGKTVYMVDFSYKRPVLLEMAAQAEGIVIIDHHDTAETELVDLPDNVQCIFDQSKSGAVLTWEYFHSSWTVPYLLLLVQDRDLWQWKLPETAEVSAALFSHEWTFDAWDKFADNWHRLRDEGSALLRKQEKDVAALVEDHNVITIRNFHGYDVPAVNCPWMFASDVGHALCEKYPDAPLSVTFMLGVDKVKFSLRSNDKIHCGHIAETFGGGGHPNAAGFALTHEEFAKTLKE